MTYSDASLTTLRDGSIKIHKAEDMVGMRAAGKLAGRGLGRLFK